MIQEPTNNPQQQAPDIARALLVLDNYEWLLSEAGAAGIEIIPLKGIDMLRTVYADHLDRPVRDIDVLCHSEEDCRKLVERLCQNGYRLEFPFSMRPKVLASKRKVSLLSGNPLRVNVDVHTAIVTKKFFSQSVASFNTDALARCEHGQMESFDRWLFLAQHAAFHFFSDAKWVRDLVLIYERFSSEERTILWQRASQYGFRRVMLAALYHVYKSVPQELQATLKALNPTATELRFLSFVWQYDRPVTRNLTGRIVSAYWEFAFVDSCMNRWRNWCSLVFPTRGVLTNMYRIKNPLTLCVFYPLNFFVSVATSFFFWCLFAFVTVKAGIRLRHAPLVF